MKKSLLILAAIGSFGFGQIQAQEIFGGQPYSYTHQLDDQGVSKYVLPTLDMNQIQAEDQARDNDGLLPLFSRLQYTNLNLDNSGTWTQLANGDRLWKLKIEGRNAKALSLGFDVFEIPNGGVLHVYNSDHTEFLGAFTHQSNEHHTEYAIPHIRGEVIILEYYEPASVQGQANINIEWVGNAYRMIKSIAEEQAEAEALRADPCQVDIRCSEGAPYWDEKKGIVRLVVVSNQGQGFCTGTLVNNTARDCKSYILSALHCAQGTSTANFNQWTFTFNYERTQCGVGLAPNNNFLVGCVKRADSGDGGGNTGSDFLLVETNDAVPDDFDAYFVGWNATTAASSSGVSIHHPSGDSKKISTYTNNLITSGWGANNTHWRVTWTGTTNGHGVTEGGSSGSPIFNTPVNGKAQIVGTLTGGSSYCNEIQPGGQNQPDFYGKMSWHWDSNPGDDLKDWLDAGNTGETEMEGTFDPCGQFTSVSEVALDAGISVYPNPSEGMFTVEVEPGLAEELQVEVYNAVGQMIISKNMKGNERLMLDLTEMSTGIYMVNLIANGQRITRNVAVLR